MPVVQPGSFLTLHYRLCGPDGTAFLDTFAAQQPATLSIGAGELAPALEQRLLGLPEGSHAVFDLPAGEAFGAHQPQMVQWVARQLIDDLGDPHAQYAVGDVVQFSMPDGQGRFAGVVRDVRSDGAVLLDFNHPLAGQPVRFEVYIIGVL